MVDLSKLRLRYNVHSRFEARPPIEVMLYNECRLGKSCVGYGIGA